MSFCKNCGAQLPDDSRFCAKCGTPVEPDQAAPAPAQPQTGGSVQLGQDGKYHWYYELNMFKSTAILGTIIKIFGIIILVMWLLDLVFSGFEDVWAVTKIMLLIFAGFVVLSLLGYLVVAVMYGGKYCVLFEMDEKGVSHVQLPKQFKKAQVMGLLAALVSGNPTTAGAGILAATRNSMYTSFDGVRSIKSFPRQHVIKVNAPLSKNQVYADDADFQFVLDYIKAHCPKAK